ncbi:rRNA maturation RNAse YbeY [Mycoplasmopsis bovis]
MPFLPLGELVISHEKVEEQAKEFGHSYAENIVIYMLMV